MISAILPLAITCLVALTLFLIRRYVTSRTTKGVLYHEKINEDAVPYTDIEPRSTFDWAATPPIKLRPFKSRYHLTMGLESMKIDDLLEVDNTYQWRIKLRRQVMQEHPSSTLAARPGSEAMISEFYTWMTGTYLPTRYPTMYSLQPASASDKTGPYLLNTVTQERIPLSVPTTTPLEALKTLASHIDTDFLFLAPSLTPEGPKYHLEAFATCFPAGFSTREKLGLPLAAIHTPVPGYAAKLERSMDRFFANLAVRKVVRRANWSVSTDGVLFSESGNHFYDGKESGGMSAAEEIEAQKRNVKVDECRLRCERQTLHRLPETNALVFAFKTYQYTLQEIKDEGSAEDLATAIEGLAKGNVPEMHYYKRGVVWGDKVVEYLRS